MNQFEPKSKFRLMCEGERNNSNKGVCEPTPEPKESE